MNEKIIVIGSNSFSGSHLVDYALENQDKVIGISRSEENHKIFLPYKDRINSDFEFYSLDLNRDIRKIIDLIDEFEPGYIYNFAAQGMVEESWENPEQWYRTNFISAVILHGNLMKRKYLKRFIQISTPEVYGSVHGSMMENTCYNPATPYAVSKAACDMSLMAYYKKYGFPVIITRAANVYGPGQQLYRLIPKTILAVKEHKKLPLHGGGMVHRSFIHIHDVIRATYLLAGIGEPGHIFHISTQTTISIRDLVKLICTKLGAEFESLVEISTKRASQDKEYRLDSSKVRSLTGWSDIIDLDTGIDQTIDWIENNYDVIGTMNREYIHRE